MKTTYEHFDSAFGNVEGYVILSPAGDYVARVAFKYPRDGASRVWCYFQAWGAPMVRGFAGGWGYNKGQAAMREACRKYLAASPADRAPLGEHIANAVIGADSAGRDWRRTLEDAGYRVFHVFG